jgi:two-component system sensor histidine kinase/response regulator
MTEELFSKTILIVDDTPENLDILNGLLSDFKRKVAINGNKALKIANSDNPPDLILLDVMMPGIDGYEVCKRLRSNEKTKDIPVIFLTAKVQKQDIIKGFEVGGQDYVTKPFDHIELLHRVKTQLELKSQRETLEKMNEILDKKVKERTLELEITNAKLEETLAKLQGLNKAKTNFLRLVSHELRTPLNGIMGSAYFLKEIVKEPSMIEFIDMLKISAERLEHLSNIALEITDMQTVGRVELYETINAKDLINRLVEEFNKSHTISNEIDTSEVKPVELKGDRERVTKAFTEVLTNAYKYSLNDDIIKISSGLNDNNTKWICIENSSNFISDEQLVEMRTPFGLANEHMDGNTGLGLAFVNTVMAYHGGELDITYNNGITKVCLIFKA